MSWAETWGRGDRVSVGVLAHRVSIKALAKRVWKEIDADNVPGLAAQTSYYFVLSLFPFLIFLGLTHFVTNS